MCYDMNYWLTNLKEEKEKLLKQIQEKLERVEEIDNIIDLEYSDWNYYCEKNIGDNG